jgi:hypothetical protein
VKEYLSFELYRTDRPARYQKTWGRRERDLRGVTAVHFLILFSFAGLWLVSSQKIFRYILKTLIKRVISIRASLRGHFNQVEPVEVWIGRAEKVKVSPGEISWLSTKRQLKTTLMWKKFLVLNRELGQNLALTAHWSDKLFR